VSPIFTVISSAAELSANADDPAESRNLLFWLRLQTADSSTSLGMTMRFVFSTAESRGRGRPRHTFSSSGELLVAEAGGQMVVHHAYGLHEGVADGGADEGESALLQVFAYGV
jgi:hypothetical protein